MKGKKGFTLTELLVVIVILGIITGISIPLIRNLGEKNGRRKYTTYADSMQYSAKLYVDSYNEDLFGHHVSGCAYISYKQLEEKGLLKDIPEADISCNSENTFVKVVKLNTKYTYTEFLGCGDKVNDAVKDVSITYPEENTIYEMDSDVCGLDASNINITVDPFDPNKFAKRHKTHIVLTSPTGINNNVEIYAAWRKDQNVENVTSWKKIVVKVPEGQRAKVESGEEIRIQSDEEVTPPNENGSYYLLLKVERLDDLYGEHWINKQTEESKYLWFGPFKVDNIPPVCINSGDSTTWTKENRKITFGCRDNEATDSGCLSGSSGGSKTFTTTTKTSNIAAYVIKDNAGNTTNCAARTANVYVDKTSPTCTVSGESTTWTKNNRTINFGCSDGTNESGCDASASGGSKIFNTTTKTSNIAAYVIKDNVGNTTNCATRTANVYVDKTPPTCTDSGDSTTWTNKKRTIVYGCKDGTNESGCDTSASGGKREFSTTTKTAEIAAYTIKDNAGNTTNCPARTASIYVDVTPPTITAKSNPLTLGSQDYTFTSNVTVTWGASGEGTLTCNPEQSSKTGIYNVTCYATSVSKVKSENLVFNVKHSYAATPKNEYGCLPGTNYPCDPWWCPDWAYAMSACGYGAPECGCHQVFGSLCCTQGSYTTYTCPFGGTLGTDHYCYY